jgi:hypothetical protein
MRVFLMACLPDGPAVAMQKVEGSNSASRCANVPLAAGLPASGIQDPATVENMRAWLTTVVGRVCLNMLRARAARREEISVHVPDPVVDFEEHDVEHETGRVFSVMAFTVTNGKIAQIDVLLDPQRLDQLDLCIPPTAGTHR